MVQINFAQKTVNVKIVYYGPGMSGKTTNLEVIHQRAPETNRGELTSISTDGDRTLFFDYMPLDLGTVAGMRTCFQLYTVPGQVYYNSTRKLVLQGVDGIIFVADSSAAMLNQNIESLRNLEENLNEYGKSLSTLPHVMQLNKRDLPDAMSVEELSRVMNPHNVPLFEAIANTGQGVFPTLKALAAGVLRQIMNESGAKSSSFAGSGASAPQPAPAPAPRSALDVAGHRPPAAGRAPAFPQQAPAPVRPAPQPPIHAPGIGARAHSAFPGQPGAAPHQQAGAGGGGFFAGPTPAAPAVRPHSVPLAAPHASAGTELHLAHPVHLSAGAPSVHARPRPAPAPGHGGGGQAPAGPRRPAPGARLARPQSAPEQTGKGRPAQKQAGSVQQKGSSRTGEIFTGVFVVVGAGVGAFLAWVVMAIL